MQQMLKCFFKRIKWYFELSGVQKAFLLLLDTYELWKKNPNDSRVKPFLVQKTPSITVKYFTKKFKVTLTIEDYTPRKTELLLSDKPCSCEQLH